MDIAYNESKQDTLYGHTQANDHLSSLIGKVVTIETKAKVKITTKNSRIILQRSLHLQDRSTADKHTFPRH